MRRLMGINTVADGFGVEPDDIREACKKLKYEGRGYETSSGPIDRIDIAVLPMLSETFGEYMS